MTPERMGQIFAELALMQRGLGTGQVWDVFFFHDDDCPCEGGAESLHACVCEPWVRFNGCTYELDAAGRLKPRDA